MSRLSLAALLLATSCAAAAQDDGPALSYGYFDASYEHQRERPTDLISEGFSVGLAMDAGAHAFFSLGYSDSHTALFARDGVNGRVETRAISGGLGGHVPLASGIDLTAGVDAIRIRTLGEDGFANDPVVRRDGVTGSLGLRCLLRDWLELHAARGYSYIEKEPAWDSSAGLALGLGELLWLDAGVWRAGDLEGWSAGLRTTFGGGGEAR